MDYGRIQELLLDVQHRHSDGSWGTLEPETSHDPSENDPEREWSNSTLFRCKTLRGGGPHPADRRTGRAPLARR